ncbi:MAG: thiamine diphosphokinase [Kiritimatiellia bacterium]
MSRTRGETVILAAGDFPRRGGAAWRLLAGAAHVVACDSAAAAYRRRFRRWPDVIVGDFDSLKCRAPGSGRCAAVAAGRRPDLVRCTDQETNDLEKALVCCALRGWRHPVVVGATGRREDHTLGNVFRALAYGVETVTDYGRFVPVCGRAALAVAKGAPVSVFATDPRTRMTSRGLEWPLDGVRFRNLYCATLNRTTATRLVLTATRPVYVYLAERN